MNSNNLLRDLKIALNSEEHTTQEWQQILQRLQEIGNRANMRLQMGAGKFLDVVEVDEKEEKKLDTDEKPA